MSTLQNFRFLFHFPRVLVLVAGLSALSACQQRVELISPAEEDLVVLNGCVISACNYLAVMKTQHRLEPDFWAKVLLVRFDNHPAGHAYCVWETDGTIYGYDRNSGGFPIPVYTRDARAIAIVLAQELGKIMKEPLSVSTAEFVESKTAELYKFSSLAAPKQERLSVIPSTNLAGRDWSLNHFNDVFDLR